MKILIILLRFDNDDTPHNPDSIKKVNTYMLPIGLAYISAYLKQAGKDVTVLNLNNQGGHVEYLVKRKVLEAKYDVVLVGGLSMYFPHIRDIISYVRKYSEDTKIIVGGGILTAQPEIMFDLLKPDYGVIGEGEQTVLELINYLENPDAYPVNINGVKGIIFKAFRMPIGKEVIQINEPREPIMDLDALPFPDYESFGFSELISNTKVTDYGGMFDIVDDPRPYPLLASRSCPYSCTFCFHPLGQKYRQRSIDNIMEEIKQNVKKYGVNIITLYDELFSNDKDRVTEFCTKFKAYSNTLPYKLWFICNNRVDSTTDEMLKIMRYSGAYLLSFGLESYSPTVLKSMNKHISPEQVNKMVHLLRENKLGLMGSFIFGDVAETCNTAKETLDFIKENRNLLGANVGAFFIIPFQGTPLYKYCVFAGKIPDELQFIKEREQNWFKYLEPMNLTNLPEKEFSKLKNEVFGLHLVSDTTATSIKKWESVAGEIFTDIQCPSCKNVSSYRDLPEPKGFSEIKVGCRHCSFRYHLVSKWYPIKRVLLKMFGFNLIYRLKKYVRG